MLRTSRTIKTYVFARNLLSVLTDRNLSQSTTNYYTELINQLSIANFDNVLMDDVLASVSFICSSSVIVNVE